MDRVLRVSGQTTSGSTSNRQWPPASQKSLCQLAISLLIFANQVERGKRTANDEEKERYSMRLKGQLTRLLMVGALAVMTTGVSQAGFCGEDQYCWHPKAISQPMAAQPSLLSAIWTMLSVLF
jgi:hypothetical protein